MSVKEMTYTEEQVKGFVSQADCAILVLRKDLGETNQDVTHITGDAENIFDLVTNLIGHISQQGNISKEALLAKIAVGAKSKSIQSNYNRRTLKMKIMKIISQIRRDFNAIYECEHCGHSYESSGYDDANFHNNVVPQFECPKCEKTADESYRGFATKYPEGMQI